MTFSMSLLSIFNITIGQIILGESYEVLLGLGLMIDISYLKYKGQYPKLIYVLAMLIKFFRHISSLTITLRYFQDTLSGPDVDKLLYLLIALLNFLPKNLA